MQEARDGLNLMVAAAATVSAALTPWTRRPGTWGERANGMFAVLGFLFVPVYGALWWPKEPQQALWYFWGLTAVLLFIGRLRGVWLRRRGYVVHSQYNGKPILPGPERTMKGVIQPLIVAAIGFCICSVNVPLGSYLMLAAGGQTVVAAFQGSMEQARLRQMRDAQLESEYFTSRMQNFR